MADLRPLHRAARRSAGRRPAAVADTTIDGIIRLMVGREVDSAVRPAAGGARARRGRARGRGPDAARGDDPGPARRRARRRHARGRAAARSSGSPAWSAPAAPSWRARSSAPIRSTPADVLIDGAPVDDPLAARRHPPRHRPGARGPQAAGAVPGAGRARQHQHRGARPAARWRWLRRRAGRARAGRGVPRGRSTSAWPGRSSWSPTSRAATSRRWCWRAGWRCSRKVLIVDEPTRGIDVGAKVEVHHLLFELARRRHRHHRDLLGAARGAGASATASSPCARAGSPARSAAATATQETLMAMMTRSRARRAA